MTEENATNNAWWHRHRWGFAGIGLLLGFLALNFPLVFGLGVANWDGDGYFFPYYVLVADFARAGSILAWDPWTNGGVPVLGDPQVGALSPLTVGFGLLTGGSSSGFIVYWLFVWWLGGVGLFLLARHLGVPLWVALVVGINYLFCAVYTGNAQYTSWLVGFSFLPWIVWRLDAALGRHSWLAAAQAGALWGLSASAGYPAFTMATAGFCALWAFGRALTTEGSDAAGPSTRGQRLAFSAASLGIIAALGLVILAPAYASFFVDGAGYHRRVEPLDRMQAVGGNDLAPGALTTLFSPYPALLKLLSPGDIFLGTDVSSCSLYLGAITLTFAVFALAAQPRNRWRWWLLIIAGFFLAIALGDALPVRGVLYDLVYPTRFFRHSALFRAYALFAVAALALEGGRDFAAALGNSERGSRKRYLYVAGGCVALAIVAYGALSWIAPGARRELDSWGSVQFSVAWLGVCVLGVSMLLVRGRKSALLVPALAVGLATADAFLTSAVSRPITMNTDRSAVQRWQALDKAHIPSLDLAYRGLGRTPTPCGGAPCKVNYQLVTKVATYNAFTTEKNDLHEFTARNEKLRAMATGVERLWFSAAPARSSPRDDAVDAFMGRAGELEVAPLVLTSRDEMLATSGSPATAEELAAIASAPPVAPIKGVIEIYTPNRLSLRVTAPEDGWLLVTDRWARGWSASVNGQAVPVEVGTSYTVRSALRPART